MSRDVHHERCLITFDPTIGNALKLLLAAVMGWRSQVIINNVDVSFRGEL